jgi:rod shape-determining protein MreB
MIKMKIGNAYSGEGIGDLEVKGRDLVTGIPKILQINGEEARFMISEEVNAIVEAVRSGLEQMPPELSADILDRGIVLCGGGALLKNLDVLLKEETRVPVTVAENPLLTVALGAGKALDNLRVLKDVLLD